MENNYIEAKCFTNLDDYHCNITKFVAIPRVGEYVTCQYKGHSSRLKIVSIEHGEGNVWINEERVTRPLIRVELNK